MKIEPAQTRQYHCPETETLCSKCESHCEAAQPVQPARAQEPDLLDLKLPIAVRVGGGIFGKGVSLRTVANKLKLIQDTYDNDLKARMSKQSICRENKTEAPAAAINEQTLSELKNMVRAYVRLLEAGKDRIESLGGDCDPVDRMEAGDSNLTTAKAAIAAAEAQIKEHGL